jgi:8-oxo-dGTP diphosphatase
MRQCNAQGEIRVAGGVVFCLQTANAQIAMVYRATYKDWSIPKGHVEQDEDDLSAALREVLEETGLACTATNELGRMHYRDRKARTKVVRYWMMFPMSSRSRSADKGHDVGWFGLEEAARIATRSGERDFLSQLSGLAKVVQNGDKYSIQIQDQLIVVHEAL